MQGRFIVALKETVDHRFVTDVLQKRFPEYEIYTGKDGPCLDLIDIKRVSSQHLLVAGIASSLLGLCHQYFAPCFHWLRLCNAAMSQSTLEVSGSKRAGYYVTACRHRNNYVMLFAAALLEHFLLWQSQRHCSKLSHLDKCTPEVPMPLP